MKGSIINLVQEQVWAILPKQLDAIHNILYARYFGSGIDLEQVSIELGRELDNKFEVTHHQVQQHISSGADGKTIKTSYNVGVIPIHGTIAKRMNMFHDISGGVSTEIVKKTISGMVSDPAIDAIVLDIDSGGGTLDGTMELANAIFEARGTKPIVAYANGLMASAAYWIGSAADMVTAYDTTSIGSIGVFTAHYDYSQYNEKMGIKPTFIYQGKYKVMGNEDEPLSPEGKDYLQKHVDQAFKLFVDSVAKNRNVSVDECMKKLVDGSQIYFAEDAKERGLIDDIMSLEQTIEMAASMAADGLGDKPGDQAYGANWIAAQIAARELSDSQGDGITKDDFSKEEKMTLAELKEKHSDLYQQVYEAGKAEANEKEVKLTAEVETWKKTCSGHETVVTDLQAQIKQLDKELTIEKMTSKTKEEQAQADAIMNKILEASAISESLHDKVRAMVDHNKFKTDGAFDAEAFTGVFMAEVADWEGKVPTGTNLGAGLAKTDDHDTTPKGHYSEENVEILSNYKKNK